MVKLIGALVAVMAIVKHGLSREESPDHMSQADWNALDV